MTSASTNGETQQTTAKTATETATERKEEYMLVCRELKDENSCLAIYRRQATCGGRTFLKRREKGQKPIVGAALGVLSLTSFAVMPFPG